MPEGLSLLAREGDLRKVARDRPPLTWAFRTKLAPNQGPPGASFAGGLLGPPQHISPRPLPPALCPRAPQTVSTHLAAAKRGEKPCAVPQAAAEAPVPSTPV